MTQHLVSLANLKDSFNSYHSAEPFDHCVVDNFLPEELAHAIESEFLDFDNPAWFEYNNVTEIKKQNKDWGLFPRHTYQLFYYLNSPAFVDVLSDLVGVPLYADPGLHGGGWHIHGPGGKLNPHQDYSIHPKIGLQRKLNIILYVSRDLDQEAYGGHLGLWTADESGPTGLAKEIAPVFNRAVVFDTTQNSWHGLSRSLTQPEGVYRKSLAIYYLTDPPVDANTRSRALFAPTTDQQGNQEVLDFIAKRSR